MPKTIKVLHLDDQPEQASWIPREIANWFWKNFRKDMATTDLMQEDDAETHFKLHVKIGEDELYIEYLIVPTVDEFLAAIKEHGLDTVLIVLDQAIMNDFEAGGRAYLEIERQSKVLAEKVIVLTAYPGATCSQLHWSVDDERLIAKPPEMIKIIKRFIGGISERVMNGTRLELTRRLAAEEAR